MYRHRKLITLSLSDDGQELIESLLSYEIMTGIIEGEAFMRNPKDSECAQGYFKPLDQRPDSTYNPYFFLRKEVIQPHLPIRLPCYDFTPVIRPAFGSSLLKGWVTDFGRC